MPRRPSFERLVLLEVTLTQPFAEACVPNGESRPYLYVFMIADVVERGRISVSLRPIDHEGIPGLFPVSGHLVVVHPLYRVHCDRTARRRR